MGIDRLFDLNFILREHLPPGLLRPKNPPEARRLETLAQQNIKRRIELNYPEDVLNLSKFVKVANDWLTIITAGKTSLTNDDLRQYLAYGLILPRYRGQPHIKALTTERTFIFSPEGHLQKITFSKEKDYSGLLPYRSCRAIIDNPSPLHPDTRDYGRGTSLFIFSQIADLAEVHLRTKVTIDLLTMTPEKYGDLRDLKLGQLRQSATKTGKPKFCENPQCFSLVPLGQQRYCSRKCHTVTRNAKKPKSTSRVENYYQKRRPFSFNSPPDLPSLPVEE